MSLNDPLSNALSKINASEKLSKEICVIYPVSKLIKDVLTVMHNNRYIGEYKEVINKRGNYINLNMIERINKCGSIKPRFAVSYTELEKYEKRYLPAKDFGLIIISTHKGVMSHIEAKKKKLGGKLIAYCY